MGGRSSSTSSTEGLPVGADVAPIRAGRVSAAHGLDGSVKVAEPVAGVLRVGLAVGVGGRQLEVERVAGTAARPIVRFAGVGDRNAAEALRGLELFVERDDAPELGEDEWWTSDLIGCLVADGDTEIGEVDRVLGLPSCEVLGVRRAAGDELLVPLVSDAVRLVDVAARRIDVDLVFLGESDA